MINFPAEWHPQSAVQLTFPHKNSDWSDVIEEAENCFIDIISTISQYQTVIVVCQDQSYVSSLLSDQANIIFVEIPSNDSWARDHAPITILKNSCAILLDFIFNGWGLKFAANHDNMISNRMHELGVFGSTEFRRLNFILEGGAIESDGNGTIMTTSKCLLSDNRNLGLSKNDIEKQLSKYLGAEHILWLDLGYLEGDDTDGHIDTLARFVNETTIAYVSCSDQTDSHYEELKRMENQLKTFKTKSGQAYNLIPLPMAPTRYDSHERLPATYANFLIINKAVLVPTYNQEDKDLEAIEILQTLFVDREVIGIDCSTLIKQHGSLHCVCMQYPMEVEIIAN